MNEDAKKVHPLRRRKHRRGKRGGKRVREQRATPVLRLVPVSDPAPLVSLRARLAALSQRTA